MEPQGPKDRILFVYVLVGLNEKNGKCGGHIRQAVTLYQRLNRLTLFLWKHLWAFFTKCVKIRFNIIVPCTCRTPRGWFSLYITLPFLGGKSPFSKMFSCVIKRRCSLWEDRLRHVSIPIRHCYTSRKFDVTERVRTGLYRLDSDNVNSFTSPPPHFECLLATSSICFFFRNGWKISRIGA